MRDYRLLIIYCIFAVLILFFSDLLGAAYVTDGSEYIPDSESESSSVGEFILSFFLLQMQDYIFVIIMTVLIMLMLLCGSI